MDRKDSFAGLRVYMVGIGGCGMSGLARMLRAQGAGIAGSDASPSETTDALEREGIEVGFDQASAELPHPCDLIVASAAIRPDHPQLAEAARRSIPILTYARALGRCMACATGVAVAGTHGKSTTTAMLGAALADAGLDPTVIVGATCAQLREGCLRVRADRQPSASPGAEPAPTGFRLGADVVPTGPLRGRPGLLVAEACEFNRSFHHLRPVVASISSVEADHLDIYGTLDAVVESFHQFARLLPPAADGGRLLIAHDGAHRREVTAGVSCSVETIGFAPAADWVVSWEASTGHTEIRHGGELLAAWEGRLPGEHNAMNAATAWVLARWLGADGAVVAHSLGEFRGVDRRTQFLGERPHPAGGSVRVYDDYGHHPTEVDATLRALRQFERPQERGGKLVCVFQPHQHSRTRHLMSEFAAAFGSADAVIVPHIYFVRDSAAEKQLVSAADLVDRLRQRGVRAMHLYPFEAIVEQLENLCDPGDVLVVMGAGPVYEVARGYMRGAPGHEPDEAILAGAGGAGRGGPGRDARGRA